MWNNNENLSSKNEENSRLVNSLVQNILGINKKSSNLHCHTIIGTIQVSKYALKLKFKSLKKFKKINQYLKSRTQTILCLNIKNIYRIEVQLIKILNVVLIIDIYMVYYSRKFKINM